MLGSADETYLRFDRAGFLTGNWAGLIHIVRILICQIDRGRFKVCPERWIIESAALNEVDEVMEPADF